MKENEIEKLQTGVISLEFYISTVNILNMDVNLQKNLAEVTYLPSEPAVWPILAKDERNYVGLERRLQIFMQNKNPLPVLIDEIEEKGIRVDYHHNLWIRVKR